MKKGGLVLLFLLFLPLTVVPVRAAAEDELSAYIEEAKDSFLSQLDSETRALMNDLGLDDPGSDGGIDVSWDALLGFFRGDARTTLTETLRSFAAPALAVLVFAFVAALVGEKGAGALEIAAVCVAALQGVSVLEPLLSAGAALLHTGAGFMKAFLPVYAGLAAFSGSPTAALSMQTLVFGLCEGLSACAEGLCVQGTGCFAGLCCALSLSTQVKMPKFLSAANRTMTWVLGLLCTVFTGVLGARSVLSAAADTAAGKSVRFLLSSAIPIVGAAMSDAYSSLVASIHLIRGSFAVVGVAVLLALHLPVLVQSLAALVSFKALAAMGDALGVAKVSGVFQGFALALKFVLLLGVLELFLLMIAIGLLLQMKGGV